MATVLYRLARFSFRRRGVVVAIWAAILLALGAGTLTLSGQLSNAISIPGTESQHAIDRLKERFPQAGIGGATARVAIQAPPGQTLAEPANAESVGRLIAALNALPGVNPVAPPSMTGAISPDGRMALAQVTYRVTATEITDEDRRALTATADEAREAGLTVEFGGDAMQEIPVTGVTEGLGVVVAALVLAITFGSLIAAGMPLLTALIGIGVGMAGLFTISGFVELNSYAPILALMLGLAVGIDYALFIVSRYRHELAEGHEPEEAAGRSIGTAGSAVVFAGLTVIIALAGLTVVGIPFLGQMGLAASATVAVAVLVALTLLPGILGFAGRRVLGKRTLRRDKMPYGERWARFVSRHRVPVLVVAVAGLIVLAIPALSMRLALPDDSTAPPGSTQRMAYDMVSASMGPGMNGPLVVVVDTAAGQSPDEVANQIWRLDDVAMVTPPQRNQANDTALITVIPKSGPGSEETQQLVHDIRSHFDQGVAVTGQTAVQIDVSDKLKSAMVPYLAMIVGLAFLLLMLVFRSLVVPIKATLGFLGSVVATFGAVVAVFQWGWLSDLLGIATTAPIMSMLPILLIGVLFGLAMDYQVFLVTRMREEHVHGSPAGEAVIIGCHHGSRVVVAAALIMISVFSGFVLADTTLIQSMGFALAFGVAIDAFVVRMTIVPAVMALLGSRAWWLPRLLDRALPTVDVEGERLRKRVTETV